MGGSESLIPRSVRVAVFEAASDCREYCLCQAKFSPSPFSIEHVVPRTKGGSNGFGNLAMACMGCNGHKHAHQQYTDPLSGEVTRLFHPRRDSWSEHFRWSEDYAYVIGITPIGRATVARLHLNRAGVVNLRRTLQRLELHPPPHQRPNT